MGLRAMSCRQGCEPQTSFRSQLRRGLFLSQHSRNHPSELLLDFIGSQCSRPKVQGTAYTHRTATNLARSVYHTRHREKQLGTHTVNRIVQG